MRAQRGPPAQENSHLDQAATEIDDAVNRPGRVGPVDVFQDGVGPGVEGARNEIPKVLDEPLRILLSPHVDQICSLRPRLLPHVSGSHQVRSIDFCRSQLRGTLKRHQH